MKRGEKTHSEQSWCGCCVKKTLLLETQHRFTLDTEGTYHRPKDNTTKPPKLLSQWVLLKYSKTATSPKPTQKGVSGVLHSFQRLQAALSAGECPFWCLRCCRSSSRQFCCFLLLLGTWLVSELSLQLDVSEILLCSFMAYPEREVPSYFFFNFVDFLKLFWVVSLLV